MGFIPAILITEPQLGSVVEEGLAAGGVTPYQHSVVKWCQPTAVLIIRRCPQRQQYLKNRKQTIFYYKHKFILIMVLRGCLCYQQSSVHMRSDSLVERGQAILCPEVNVSSPHYQHPDDLPSARLRLYGQSEWRLCHTHTHTHTKPEDCFTFSCNCG